MPWRGTRDPYRIWVSEVMLQQTTVGAVLGRYRAFLERFPDVFALARASEPSVLAAWSGLGYYARARNLRRAAREIVRRHGGRLPRDPETLETLPGFGPYMAAAVASLAFGAHRPAADANVTRVLSRLCALDGVAGSRQLTEAVLARAARLLPRRRPGDGTAAVMDLGQTVCTPRKPACAECPLAAECEARRLGEPEAYPRRPRRRPSVRVHFAAACAVRDGRTLLLRRDAALLKGLWQFPSAEGRGPASARRRLARAVAGLGLRLEATASAGSARHMILHRRLEIAVYRAQAVRQPHSESRTAGRWFTPVQLEKAAIPTLTRKIAIASGFLQENPRA